jgi:hypothetical protein
VLLVYFMLCAEDYRWQWRAFAGAGMTGGYVFLNALGFWMMKISFGGLTGAVLYIGYSALIGFLVFLLSGELFLSLLLPLLSNCGLRQALSASYQRSCSRGASMVRSRLTERRQRGRFRSALLLTACLDRNSANKLLNMEVFVCCRSRSLFLEQRYYYVCPYRQSACVTTALWMQIVEISDARRKPKPRAGD